MDDEVKWEQLILRLQGEARRTLRTSPSNGCAIIPVHVIVDSQGNLLFWILADGRRVEPSKDAKQILTALVGR